MRVVEVLRYMHAFSEEGASLRQVYIEYQAAVHEVQRVAQLISYLETRRLS